MLGRRNNNCLGLNINYLSLELISKTTSFMFQGIVVPKLILGPFLTMSVRNGPNLQSYLFMSISLNPRRVEQNYTIYVQKTAKTIY